MRKTRFAVGVLTVFLLSAPVSFVTAQEQPSSQERQILSAMAALAASTAVGGGGASAYDDVLAPDFSRWTLGSNSVSDRDEIVALIREWLDSGWRVVSHEDDIIEIRVVGSTAFSRRIVEEVHRGPEGQRTEVRAALSEVWVRGDDGAVWTLRRADLTALGSG